MVQAIHKLYKDNIRKNKPVHRGGQPAALEPHVALYLVSNCSYTHNQRRLCWGVGGAGGAGGARIPLQAELFSSLLSFEGAFSGTVDCLV